MNHSIRKASDAQGKLTQPIALKEAKALLAELKGWNLVGGKTLRQEFMMKDFMSAVHFVNAVARAAEAEGHHPDLHLTDYRNLVIELSTHSIGGLSMNDFILAEKIDGIHRDVKQPERRRHAAAV
jgi:4a-hydroxytetrahydrobiopterin dehydratase